MFERNVGGVDRTARGAPAILFGAAAVGTVSTRGPGIAVAAGLASAGLAFNYVTGFCGLNAVLGVNTCDVDAE